MTTPPTPAGWYSDPEHAGQLRYWNGGAWTEHRSPIQDPSATAAPDYSSPQEPSPAEPQAADHGGAHRAPDSEPEQEPVTDPEQEPVTEQPTTGAPLREWSFEPPPLGPEASPHQTESAPEPMSTYEPTHEPASEPTSGPTHEPAPYADATTSTPPEPPAVEPPAGTEPREPVDNRKLVMGFGGAVAGLLVLLLLAAVYAFVIHKPDNTQAGSSRTQTSTITTHVPPTSAASPSPEAQPPPPGGGATDGPLTFAVTGVESGPTVSDPTNASLTKDAQGEFVVVRLTVQNTSPDPGQFLGTFQKLKAAGQVYSIDDEATNYVGGGFVDIPPGGQVDVRLAYDVPPGTVPETIELHADPASPGVELPVQ